MIKLIDINMKLICQRMLLIMGICRRFSPVPVKMTLILLLSSLIGFPLQAYEQAEVMIRSTPYDQKLMRTGMLDPGYAMKRVAASSSDDIGNLFMQARAFRYSKDKDGDFWQSPFETELKKSGDCEDKSVWLYHQLKQSGYQDARLVIGKLRRSDRGYHTWVTVKDRKGNLLIMDPASQKKIWRAGDFNGDFYSALYSFDGVSKYRHYSV